MKYSLETFEDIYLMDSNIENLFIGEYMGDAPGDFVKVYIFAHMYAQWNIDIEDKAIASTLKITESQLMDAWDYWEKQGVIKKKYKEENGKIDFAIEFLNLKKAMYGMGESTETDEPEEEKLSVFGNEDIKKTIDYVEGKIGKTLSTKNIETIIYLIKDRKIDIEMFTFGVDYCVNNGKTGLRYIEKVLENWKEKGINSKEGAEEYLQDNDNKYYKYRKILKSLGFNRVPTEFEKEMMDNWFDELGYSVEKVLEACKKTTGIREPNFNYVNKVLLNWREEETQKPKSEPLSKAVTQGILNKYMEHLREEAQGEAKTRKEEAFKRAPVLKEIEGEIQQIYRTRLLKLRSLSEKDRLDLEEKIDMLKNQRTQVLEDLGLGDDYFEPRYKCEICGDTCETPNGVCSCKVIRLEEAREWEKERRVK